MTQSSLPRPRRAPRRWYSSSPQELAAVSVGAALVLVLCLNILADRFYRRFDVSPAGTYTLSQATRETLRLIEEPIELTVFLSRDDPLSPSVKDMLLEYTRQTEWLSVRHVDPDRQPAEFVQLQNEYGLFQAKTQAGRLVTDTSVVVARGAQRWLISADDLTAIEGTNSVRPVLEHALTDGIRRVLEFEPFTVCFSVGHEEMSTTDGSARGAEELKYRLERDNYTTRTLDPRTNSAPSDLKECQLVIVAGAGIPWSRLAVQRLQERLQQGTHVLLALPALIDERNRVQASGLEALLESQGIRALDELVLERAPERILAGPAGGVLFFAAPQSHEITHGLLLGDEGDRVRLSLARALTLVPGSGAQSLLESSAQAVAVKSLQQSELDSTAFDEHTGPFVLAAAVRSAQPSGGRLVVLGSVEPLRAQVWRDPQRLYDKAFIESALAWLVARPALVSVPAAPAHPAGLNLSQEGLDEVIRYVLLYMPGTALLLGALTLYRRRRATPIQRKQRARTPQDDQHHVPR